ncbi:hypothetical protein P9112_003289 [Eukaryota sp. TZLM1-RC]
MPILKSDLIFESPIAMLSSDSEHEAITPSAITNTPSSVSAEPGTPLWGSDQNVIESPQFFTVHYHTGGDWEDEYEAVDPDVFFGT